MAKKPQQWPRMYPHGDPPWPENQTPESVVREFHGTEIENQRILVVTEHLSEFCGDFVHIYHNHGNDSITDMLFTEDEARYLRDVLVTLYPLEKPERRKR